MTRQFPDQFLWGTATAAYQIEGAAEADGRGPSIWDTFSATPGRVHNGDTGAIACDHYHRFESDLDLLVELGVGAYRFSLAWPRIQPTGTGAANPAGLDFYKRLIEGLHRRGITPMVTLYHWDLPQPLQDAGGWPVRETAQRFADYVQLAHGALEGVPLWLTLNEPAVVTWLGHGNGVHAPGISDGDASLRAAHHLMLGHGLGMQALRAGSRPGEQHGITLNLALSRPVTERPEDVAAAERNQALWNGMFLDPLLRAQLPPVLVDHLGADRFDHVQDGDLELINAPIDLLGVNNYSVAHIAARSVAAAGPGATGPSARGVIQPDVGAAQVNPPGVPVTAMNWPIEPDGLGDLLVSLHQDYPGLPPVYITENGAAFHDYANPEGAVNDPERIDYLRGYLTGIHRAIESGVDVRGYFCWSFLDNYEWAEGYSKRFGLVHVDYPTQTRTIKASGRWYAQLTRSSRLDD